MTLDERIKLLEEEIISLRIKVSDLSKNTEETTPKPKSIVGGGLDQSLISAVDIRSGMGNFLGNPVKWNNTELDGICGTQPDEPTIGYNKHAHSRYSGGALIKDVLEIVEYNWGAITNKHSQQFVQLTDNDIITTTNTNGETVKKIGLLDLVFNPDGGYDSNGNPIGTWGVSTYEINVKKCYLVERDDNGDIVIDSKGQEKKSLLYNDDSNKTSIVWDENAACFRFYAVYSPGE